MDTCQPGMIGLNLEPEMNMEMQFIELYDAERACNYFDRPNVTGVHPQCHVGYLCNDYRPSMWSGTRNGWLKPHFTFDWASDAHELPVLDLSEGSRLVDRSCDARIDLCTVQDYTLSAIMRMWQNGTAHGEYKAMEG